MPFPPKLGYDSVPFRFRKPARLARDEAEREQSSVLRGLLRRLAKACSLEEWAELHAMLTGEAEPEEAEDDLPINGTDPEGPRNALGGPQPAMDEALHRAGAGARASFFGMFPGAGRIVPTHTVGDQPSLRSRVTADGAASFAALFPNVVMPKVA